MSRARLLPALLFAGVLLSACASGADSTPTSTLVVTPTPTVEPTESPTPTPTASSTPTVEPTESPTPSPVTSRPPGGFTVAPNAEADALFLDRDTCTNERDNYEVDFPDDWWTNTQFGNGRYPACIWFSPTYYEVRNLDEVPDEIAITITWIEGAYGWLSPPEVQDEVVVGGQAAVRIELAGPQGEGGTEPEGYRSYQYVIYLGPTPEEGPNLVVETSTEHGGDYELNKAVMDRMMATIEFFGSTQ